MLQSLQMLQSLIFEPKNRIANFNVNNWITPELVYIQYNLIVHFVSENHSI